MPDTGAPWNIPYVDPTDLVRDYPQASEDLADAIADGLDAAGTLKQIISIQKTDTEAIAASSYTAISGFSLAITPSSTDSKIILLYTVPMIMDISANRIGMANLFRDSTQLLGVTGAGGEAAAGYADDTRGEPADERIIKFRVFSGHVVDEPNTTSEVTYTVQVCRPDATGSIFINRTISGGHTSLQARGRASLTAVEVLL